MPEPKIKQLALKNIEADPKLQMRAKGLDEKLVDEYAELMKAETEFPPLRVFHDNTGTNWLSRGFHRRAAAMKAGLTSLPVEMRSGTRKDALLDAAGGNASHGLRRTNADKRKAVETVLAEFPDMPSAQIADVVGVSDHFVGVVRKGKSNTRHPIKSGNDSQNDDEKTDETKSEDTPEEEPEVTVEHAGAPRATSVVATIIKALHKVQAEFSGLMAGPFKEGIRNTAASYNAVNFYDTGELIVTGTHGGVEFGLRKLSCDSIDNLLGLCGGLKLMLARVEHEPTAEQEFQDAMQNVRDFDDIKDELDAKLRSPDDTVQI